MEDRFDAVGAGLGVGVFVVGADVLAQPQQPVDGDGQSNLFVDLAAGSLVERFAGMLATAWQEVAVPSLN